ncbi:hypothetical protein ACFWXK_02995 [Streptomyces sp. NPDC059070]|uniref:hypothetical protein n=1 Tax=unclassified Streptomyces TaxID=2593676 RepID=UPI0034E24C16
MCRAKTCRTCGRTTWAGCGMHISQVKATVPAGQWCDGHPREEAASRTWRWPWQGRATRP